MKSSYIVVLIFLATLSSCWLDSPYKGYSKTSTGLHYKLRVIGDGAVQPQLGDLLKLSITYKTIDDSVFMDGFSFNELGAVIIPYKRSLFVGSFEEGLTTMNVGDSISFIVDADSLFEKFFKLPIPYFLEEERVVKMEVKLLGILSNWEYQLEYEKYRKIVERLDENEDRLLTLYLDTNRVEFSPYYNGMYFLPMRQGVGSYPKSGSKVKVHYKGYFLNGEMFESTYDRNSPLEFTMGVEGQVILGFQSAIRMLNPGAKTKFIIPSHLAFGKSGSSTNIVPAYTTVIYEIELLSTEN